MKTKINITIERGKDLYSAWAENVEGIYGQGETVEETKASIQKAIELTKENNPQAKWPKGLHEYELVYKFDTASFLNYYKGIFTNAALERITGINQRLLSNYYTGTKKPSTKQAKKIEHGLHKLANELLALEL